MKHYMLTIYDISSLYNLENKIEQNKQNIKDNRSRIDEGKKTTPMRMEEAVGSANDHGGGEEMEVSIESY